MLPLQCHINFIIPEVCPEYDIYRFIDLFSFLSVLHNTCEINDSLSVEM